MTNEQQHICALLEKLRVKYQFEKEVIYGEFFYTTVDFYLPRYMLCIRIAPAKNNDDFIRRHLGLYVMRIPKKRYLTAGELSRMIDGYKIKGIRSR